MKLLSLGLSLASLLVLSTTAPAQSLNIDIDNLFGVPTNALAAAGQAGTWNYVPANSTGTALVALNNTATSATMTRTTGSGGATAFNNLNTNGDDQALLDDAQDPGSSSTWTIAHLTAGTYNVFTYAWAPDDSTYRTGVVVNGGSLHSVGGAFSGVYVQGVTHAVDTGIVVPANGSITITLTIVSSFSTFNGVQIVDTTAPPPPAFTPYCFGNGTACPCNNVGAAGNGCPSSVNPAGANLAGAGTASITNDTLTLNGSGMTNSSCLYFQGTTQIAAGAGAVFGDGLRCAGGSVTRLGTKSNVNGASSYPGGSTPISIKGGNVAGNVRTYQCWYRNAAAFCNPETFNLTNAGQVTWGP